MIGDLTLDFYFNLFHFQTKRSHTIVSSSKFSSINSGAIFVFFVRRIFKNVVKNFVEDNRCEVHQTVLGLREGKEGWFEMFCLGGSACDDDGEMFSLMVRNTE